MFPIIAALLGAVVGSFLSQFFTHRRAVKDLNREAVADLVSQLTSVAYQVNARAQQVQMGDSLLSVLSSMALPYEASLSRARLSISDVKVRKAVQKADDAIKQCHRDLAAVRGDRPLVVKAAKEGSMEILRAVSELEIVAQDRLLPDRWKKALGRSPEYLTS